MEGGKHYHSSDKGHFGQAVWQFTHEQNELLIRLSSLLDMLDFKMMSTINWENTLITQSLQRQYVDNSNTHQKSDWFIDDRGQRIQIVPTNDHS